MRILSFARRGLPRLVAVLSAVMFSAVLFAGEIRSFQLVSPQHGWVLTNDDLLWSSDDGRTWHAIAPAGVPARSIGGVYFADEWTGWIVVGVPQISFLDASVDVMRTNDGGATWSAAKLPIGPNEVVGYRGPASVDFSDRRHGLALLHWTSSSAFSLGALFATDDGGETWKALPAPPIAGEIFALSATDALIVGGAASTEIYVSHDGGVSWQNRPIPLASGPGDSALRLIRNAQRRPLIDERFWTGTESRHVIYESKTAGDTWHVADQTVAATEGRLSLADSETWVLEDDVPCVSPNRGCSRLSAIVRGTEHDITPPRPVSRNTSVMTPPHLLPQPLVFGSTPTRISSSPGFDKKFASSASQMQSWWGGSYYDVGFYIGGSNYNHNQPDPAVTQSWASQVSSYGWGLLPLWVGPQSACVTAPTNPPPCSPWPSCEYWLISSDLTSADSAGASNASSAASAASALGIQSGSIIYYDLEYYNNGTTTCSASASSFVNAWVRQLHQLGYKAGVYGSYYDGNYDWNSISYVPDAVWVGCSYPPCSLPSWPSGQRIFQTALNVSGLGTTIDTDQSDGPVDYFISPSTKFNIGDTVVSGGMNVRNGPGGQPNGSEASGATGTVLNGPAYGLVSGVSYQWWQVQWPDKTGWSAEDYLSKQGSQPCAFSLTPNSGTGDAAGGSGTLQITGSPSGCTGSWTATVSNGSTWLSLTGTTTGSGAGTTSVSYSYSSNPNTTSRTGTISFLGAFPASNTFTLTQNASTVTNCAFSLTPNSGTGDAAGGSGTLQITGSPSGCTGSWTATVSNGGTWLSLTGTTTGSVAGTTSVPYSYSSNPNTTSRTGTISFLGAFPASNTFTLTQNPTSVTTCSYSLNPTSTSGSASGGTGTVTVTSTPSTCSGNWSVTSNSTWLSLTGTTSGANGGSWPVNYSYGSNGTSSTRAGTLSFAGTFSGGSVFTLNQAAGGGGGTNDACSSAMPVTGNVFAANLSTANATGDPTDPTPTCGSGRNDASVWFQFTPSTSGTLEADTIGSNYDTVISTWTGSCGAFTAVAGGCNDDANGSTTSQVNFTAAGGVTYYFMVTAYSGSGGSLTFNLNFQPTQSLQPNLTPYQPSSWSDKLVVSAVQGSRTGSTTFKSTDSLYVNWAAVNNGTAATAATFYTNVLVDGTTVGSFYTDPPMNVGYSTGYVDYPIGKLAPGVHTVSFVLDTTNAIAESNESDNQYSKTITVGGTRGDFDGDGKSDVLWHNALTGDSAIWFFNGTTGNYVSIARNDGANWFPVAVGDFDGDGKADIFWRNSVTGENRIWFMNGANVVSVATMLTVPDLHWVVQGSGDFNGDGKFDILWRNTGTGDNAMWLLNGTQATYSMLLTIPDQNWALGAIGDFDGDGKYDILWHNGATGGNVIWLMNGATLSSHYQLLTTGLSWSPTGAGDFNADGKFDVFWYDTSSGNDAVWFMTGPGTMTPMMVTNPAVPPTLQRYTYGDFNGDGKADIFWRNTVTGETAIWLMNGTSYTSAAPEPGVTNQSWQPVRIR